MPKTKSKKNKTTTHLPNGKKDYSYRSTYKHKFSRARNKAQRGGLSKEEMMKKYGRFPKRKDWWGPEGSYDEWKAMWTAKYPPPQGEKVPK